MSKLPRKAIPASERSAHVAVAKQITSSDLGESGKANPASIPGSEIDLEYDEEDTAKIFIPIIKASEEQKTVTGVVLQPETVDAHGDIYDSTVIKNAAWDFLEGFQTTTKLGLMHKKFNVQFGLLESYIAPNGLVLNNKTVKEGAWVMTVRVKDAKIWKLVKEGKITGFSIGGRAKVKQLKSPNAE